MLSPLQNYHYVMQNLKHILNSQDAFVLLLRAYLYQLSMNPAELYLVHDLVLLIMSMHFYYYNDVEPLVVQK